MGHLLAYRDRLDRVLAVALVIAAAAYIGWKITESPDQAVQFAFNGLSVGAVYALLALGFTLVYSTVWFFDLFYGSAAAMGAYGVFYLRSKESLGGLYHMNILLLNVLLAAVVAGVVAWALHEGLFNRLRPRFSLKALRVAGGLLATSAGVYAGVVLTYSDYINVALSPGIGVAAAAVLAWLLCRGSRLVHAGTGKVQYAAIAAVSVAAGLYCAILAANAPGSKLYLSWVVSCLLAGTVGLALYRGLYVYMRERARSPLIMLVASLGILLAITAAITIVFESAPRTLPEGLELRRCEAQNVSVLHDPVDEFSRLRAVPVEPRGGVCEVGEDEPSFVGCEHCCLHLRQLLDGDYQQYASAPDVDPQVDTSVFWTHCWHPDNIRGLTSTTSGDYGNCGDCGVVRPVLPRHRRGDRRFGRIRRPKNTLHGRQH